MRKSTIGQRWEQLEETEAAPVIQHNRTKNWDQIGKEAEEEYKKDVEEGGGEAALQQMFKVITVLLLRLFGVRKSDQSYCFHFLAFTVNYQKILKLQPEN